MHRGPTTTKTQRGSREGVSGSRAGNGTRRNESVFHAPGEIGPRWCCASHLNAANRRKLQLQLGLPGWISVCVCVFFLFTATNAPL